jgi:hypothetical protein
MVTGVLFIGAIVIALTQVVKILAPKVSGALTIIVAGILGGVVAAIAPHIGVEPITVAQGILTGLGAAGVHTVAGQIG